MFKVASEPSQMVPAFRVLVHAETVTMVIAMVTVSAHVERSLSAPTDYFRATPEIVPRVGK